MSAPDNLPIPADGWHYLDAQRQSQGPFSLEYLQKLQQSGYFHDQTLFWREGQSAWLPLGSMPKLRGALQVATLATGVQQASAVVAGAATIARPPAEAASVADAAAPGDELGSFMAEISALEADQEVEARQGAATPPPEEQTFTDDDGTVYSWDPATHRFVPGGAAGEGPGGRTAPAYRPEDMVFQADQLDIPEYNPTGDEEEEGDSDSERAGQDKANVEESGPAAAARPSSREALLAEAKEKAAQRKQAKGSEGWFDLKKNTSVYVTGLPEDVSVQEMVEVFSKCGIIKEDDQRHPRIKIYRDEAGVPKGDGLVTFLKEPSVELAIQLLDGAPFRYGVDRAMKVAPAKFELKGEAYKPKQSAGVRKRKRKVLESLEKKALTWEGFDDKLRPTQVTVIVKHMFTLDEVLGDPLFAEELEKDVQREAGKTGRVEKIKVFKGNPEGVVSLRYATEEGADGCIKLMDGRFFAGRQLKAFKWDGYTNYNVKLAETEEEQAARLEAFGRELEQRAAP